MAARQIGWPHPGVARFTLPVRAVSGSNVPGEDVRLDSTRLSVIRIS